MFILRLYVGTFITNTVMIENTYAYCGEYNLMIQL